MCLIVQVSALSGMLSGNTCLTSIGHIGFTLAMWVGSFATNEFELRMVAFLAAFTVLTRRLLGHCMFAHARGSSSMKGFRYDAIYLIPLLVSILRIALS